MALDSVPSGEAAEAPALTPPPSQWFQGVTVEYARPSRHHRFWAIPLLGLAAKLIVLIPHFIILYVLQFIVRLSQLILWIPVLLGGKMPLWGYALLGGWIRWTIRVQAFLLGVTDEYPPFSIRSGTEDGRDYQVQVRVEIPEHHHRFWAIPILGLAVKLVILIPHLIILTVLGALAYVVSLVLWIPVLFSGRYPEWGYQLVGGTLRWSMRVLAFLDGLTDRYPPFSLN
ncbi:MAG TPA: DUF4389 domain-containing protein [Chloroflexota bacterium]|nr:DUF4389 domain-containing protein [Chloroflexota bacterium]